MAKDAKKTKTKAKINWGWDAPEDRRGKATRSTSRGKSSRTTKKVEITDDISITVSSGTRGRRKGMNLGLKATLIILLVTIIGCAIGATACWMATRNDCFTIIGMEEITLTLKAEDETDFNETNSYIDEGVKVVSFGRNISKDVYVETNLTYKDGRYIADEVGTYYMIYKVDDIKYGKIFTVERIRLITFVESNPDVDVD